MGFVRSVNRISNAFAAMAMVQVMILMLMMVYEVICRFGFNAPNIWAYDAAYMISGTLFLLGGGFALKENAHVRIDFLSHRFSPRATFFIENGFSLCLLLPILGIIIWAISGKAWKAFATGQTDYTSPWAPVMWPFYSLIAIGLAVLWLQILAQVVERFSARSANLARSTTA